MLEVFEISDNETVEYAINHHSLGAKLILKNPASSIHYLSLQYFKVLINNFNHISFDFLLDTDNDLTVCLEAIDLSFPYIIFSGNDPIMNSLHSRAMYYMSSIFPSVDIALRKLSNHH
jgi:hypothetical protein